MERVGFCESKSLRVFFLRNNCEGKARCRGKGEICGGVSICRGATGDMVGSVFKKKIDQYKLGHSFKKIQNYFFKKLEKISKNFLAHFSENRLCQKIYKSNFLKISLKFPTFVIVKTLNLRDSLYYNYYA